MILRDKRKKGKFIAWQLTLKNHTWPMLENIQRLSILRKPKPVKSRSISILFHFTYYTLLFSIWEVMIQDDYQDTKKIKCCDLNTEYWCYNKLAQPLLMFLKYKNWLYFNYDFVSRRPEIWASLFPWPDLIIFCQRFYECNKCQYFAQYNSYESCKRI